MAKKNITRNTGSEIGSAGTPRENAKIETATAHMQTFTFFAPTSKSVQLLGDFTEWQKTPINMQRGADGIWRTVIHLPPGTHHYRFLVDGQWRDDPDCTVMAENPYGGRNAVRQVA